MTISILNSIRADRSFHSVICGTLLILLSACQAANETTQNSAKQSIGNKSETVANTSQHQPDRTITSSEPNIVTAEQVSYNYKALLKRAVMDKPWGEPALLEAPLDAESEMACRPRSINAKNPNFNLVLPEAVTNRSHNLIAVTPAGYVFQIYSPYGEDVELADIIVPSNDISWPKAKTQSNFTVSASDLQGLGRNQNEPTPIFLQKGVYIFALVNSSDSTLLKTNGDNLTVYAACSIHWTP